MAVKYVCLGLPCAHVVGQKCMAVTVETKRDDVGSIYLS